MASNHLLYDIRAAGKTGRILIYSDIGRGPGELSSRAFQADLSALGPVTKIDAHINSMGGSVLEGLAMYHALKNHPATVHVYIDSMAGSIASIIAMAGDRVYIADTGRFAIHNPSIGIVGRAPDLRRIADDLDGYTADFIKIYAAKSRQSPELIRQLLDEESIMAADEALRLGFVDEVITSPAMAAHFSSFQSEPGSQTNPNHSSTPADTAPAVPKTKKEIVMPDNTPDPRDELKAYVAKFGGEAGAKYFLDGLSLADATAKHAEDAAARLTLEVADLKQQLTAKDTRLAELAAELEEAQASIQALSDGQTPVAPGSEPASDPETPEKIDVIAKHRELVASGIAPGEAWKEVIRNHPAEYKAQILNPKD